MKRIIITLITITSMVGLASAQSTVRFGNITEATLGLQVGKTTRITSFQGGEIEDARRRNLYPAPRIATAFGVHLGNLLFVGPGVAYMFQPSDDENGYSHQVSAFGQARLHANSMLVRPFVGIKGGYHFASWEQTNGLFDKDWYKWDGLFVEPAIGLSFQLQENKYFNASLGYQFVQAGNRIKQSIMTESGQPIVEAALIENYHRLLLSVGLTF